MRLVGVARFNATLLLHSIPYSCNCHSFCPSLTVLGVPKSAAMLLLMWSLVFSTLSLFSSATTCYFRDGTISPNAPCAAAGDGPCCFTEQVCTSKNLCLGDPGSPPSVVNRGSCTDPTWSSPLLSFALWNWWVFVCIHIATKLGLMRNIDNPAGGSNLVSCGMGIFCCWDQAQNCCSNVSSIFVIGSTTVLRRWVLRLR